MRRAIVAAAIGAAVLLPPQTALAQSVDELTERDVVTNATVPTPPTAFVGIKPCRLVDTRGTGGLFTGPFGPPKLPALTERVFPVAGYCGIPSTAQAVSANLTATEEEDRGWVAVWPEGAPRPSPLVSSINFIPGVNVANAIVAPLGTNGGITLLSRVSTHVIVDVNGYYATGATRLVVDSTGQIVGPLDTWDSANAFALLVIDGRFIGVPVQKNGFALHRTDFYYESSDCTGTPYLSAAGLTDYSLGFSTNMLLQGDGSTLYYQKLPYHYGEMNSHLDSGYGCLVGAKSEYWATVGEYDIRRFVPPFHIE